MLSALLVPLFPLFSRLVAQNKFDEESQKVAFRKAYEKALSLMSEGAKNAITELHGSLDKWLETKIEASVNMAKK